MMRLMTIPVTIEEVHPDDERPATKRDVRLLKLDVAALEAKLDSRFNDLRDHFDAAVENIIDELRGANSDEISLLKDSEANHEQRLTAVERRIGLR